MDSSPRYRELIAALTLQISRGRPLEALAMIDSLIAKGNEETRATLVADLSVLRAVAELEAMRLQAVDQTSASRSVPYRPTESTVVTILRFATRILPALEHETADGTNPTLSCQLSTELFREPNLAQEKGLVSVPLSDREFQVLQQVALGKSNQCVAGALGISEGTVKKHLSSVLTKLGADNRTHAVARARELRMI
ncbi:MAG: response regulator transcription factor [Thermomicrobiales bacterium]|nr:response regulator transcription factor [Thermomicrobiales bacterium]MCO5223508.1 LuxR C-terminal-related transcriptional regulator [Thermomicrobiales bacterium]